MQASLEHQALTRDIILSVIDPSQDSDTVLQRALGTAKFMSPNAHLHFYITPDLDSLHSMEDAQLCRDESWLNTLTDQARAAEVSYSYEFAWDCAWEEGVANAALRHRASVILLPLTEKTNDWRNLFHDRTWGLLRSSPCPVWVIHPKKEHHYKTVLAAVRLQQDGASFHRLNRIIIDKARWLAEHHHSDLHIVNAYQDSLYYPDRAKLAKLAGVPNTNIHIHSGSPEQVVEQVAKELNAGAVVMGTPARHAAFGLRGTSARVINRLQSDVLALN